MEIAETKTAKIWKSNEGIVRVSYKPGTIETIIEARESLYLLKDFTKPEKFPVLVDIRQLKSIDKESRALYAGKETDDIHKATGILVSSPISRVIGDFFLGVNKPNRPIKMFTSEEKALDWLRKYL